MSFSPARTATLIGAPTDVGASVRGSSMGPEAMRVAGLQTALANRGLRVFDRGNLNGPGNPWQTPVDGYRAPDDFQRVMMGQSCTGVSSPNAPVPPPANQYPAPAISAPVSGTAATQSVTAPAATAGAAPGFKL